MNVFMLFFAILSNYSLFFANAQASNTGIPIMCIYKDAHDQKMVIYSKDSYELGSLKERQVEDKIRFFDQDGSMVEGTDGINISYICSSYHYVIKPELAKELFKTCLDHQPKEPTSELYEVRAFADRSYDFGYIAKDGYPISVALDGFYQRLDTNLFREGGFIPTEKIKQFGKSETRKVLEHVGITSTYVFSPVAQAVAINELDSRIDSHLSDPEKAISHQFPDQTYYKKYGAWSLQGYATTFVSVSSLLYGYSAKDSEAQYRIKPTNEAIRNLRYLILSYLEEKLRKFENVKKEVKRPILDVLTSLKTFDRPSSLSDGEFEKMKPVLESFLNREILGSNVPFVSWLLDEAPISALLKDLIPDGFQWNAALTNDRQSIKTQFNEEKTVFIEFF